MTYLLLAVQMLIPLILLLSPFILYREGGKRMRVFYLSMASSPRSRKAFMLGLAIGVLILSYTSFALKGAGLWQIPSLMLGLVLLRYKSTDAMLHWLHEDRVVQGTAFGLWLLSMAVPGLFSLSASVGLLIIASMFYPSWEIIRRADFSRSYLEFHLSDEDLAGLYF